jgi:hypothetical protein
MAITVSILNTIYCPYYDNTQSTMLIRGTLAFSGSYPGDPGDPINFTTHPVGVGNPIVSVQRPIGMQFWEEPLSGTLPSGVAGMLWYRNVNAKPTIANGTIAVVGGATMVAGTFTAANALSTAAYPAAILAAKVFFEAIFVLGR